MKHQRINIEEFTKTQMTVWDYIQSRGWDIYLAKTAQEADDIFCEIDDLWQKYFPVYAADWGDDWWWTKRYASFVDNWFIKPVVENHNYGTINITININGKEEVK